MFISVSRTNIDIDDDLLAKAMTVYGLPTKRETVNFALRKLVGDPMTREEMLDMEGMGWGEGIELSDLRDDPFRLT